jgi:hypothetical protein
LKGATISANASSVGMCRPGKHPERLPFLPYAPPSILSL